MHLKNSGIDKEILAFGNIQRAMVGHGAAPVYKD